MYRVYASTIKMQSVQGICCVGQTSAQCELQMQFKCKVHKSAESSTLILQ